MPLRRLPRSADAPHAERAPPFVLLGAFLLFFWRFGYTYASGDQDEFLPYLLHRMDPRLFAVDWFVQTQAEAFSVRTYFVMALQPFAEALPLWLAVALVYAAAWLLIAHGLYRLAYAFAPDGLAASVATVGTLVLTWRWTLGGNALAYGVLAPELVAWALVLPALRLFLEQRWGLAGALLGLAALAQVLAGLLTAGVLGFLLLLDPFGRRTPKSSGRAALAFGGVFALCASPTLVPLALQTVTGTGGSGLGPPSTFYILAVFRAPHHYLPTSFPWLDYARFGALLAGGLFALHRLRGGAAFHHARFIRRFLLVTAIACAGTVVFTTVWPVLFVTKLQAFKLTVLAKALLVIVISAWLVRAIPTTWRDRLEALLALRRGGLALVLLLWTATLGAGVAGVGRPGRLLEPVAHRTSALGQIERWARAETAWTSRFAVPPSVSSFRLNARRAIAVNFKAFPHRDAPVHAWYRRLTDWAPLPPASHGPDVLARLDSAYHALDARESLERMDAYDVDYLLRARPLPTPHDGLRVASRTSPWTVYRRTSVTPARTARGGG